MFYWIYKGDKLKKIQFLKVSIKHLQIIVNFFSLSRNIFGWFCYNYLPFLSEETVDETH